MRTGFGPVANLVARLTSFDSSKVERALRLTATAYREGIAAALQG